jgi:hypothetical protein
MGRTKQGSEEGTFDHNVDRYPEFGPAMRRIVQEAELPAGPVERIEVTFLADGSATYRVWAARAEEADGGYIPPATS